MGGLRGQMEFRATVTITEHGHDPENGLRLMRGFRAAHPEVGPVVDQDTSTGEITVTFAFDADDLLSAMNVWPAIFVAGASESGLPPSDLADFRLAAEVVPLSDAPERGGAGRKLQPA